jgi:exodeoxyribonuclease VII small subunit
MSEQTPDKSKSFEDAMADLEAIVESLESGETPLDEMMEKYEKGMDLLKLCRNRLNKAELKIQKIENTKDGLVATDLDQTA